MRPNKLRELFPYTTSAAISLWEPKQECLVVKGCIGSSARANDVLPSDEGYAARIVRERQPLFLVDTSQQPEPGSDPSMRSYVGVPLLEGDDLIGTLELASDRVGAFSRENLATLRVVASQAAVAIGNARLYTETLLRADELATLNTPLDLIEEKPGRAIYKVTWESPDKCELSYSIEQMLLARTIGGVSREAWSNMTIADIRGASRGMGFGGKQRHGSNYSYSRLDPVTEEAEEETE